MTRCEVMKIFVVETRSRGGDFFTADYYFSERCGHFFVKLASGHRWCLWNHNIIMANQINMEAGWTQKRVCLLSPTSHFSRFSPTYDATEGQYTTGGATGPFPPDGAQVCDRKASLFSAQCQATSAGKWPLPALDPHWSKIWARLRPSTFLVLYALMTTLH